MKILLFDVEKRIKQYFEKFMPQLLIFQNIYLHCAR